MQSGWNFQQLASIWFKVFIKKCRSKPFPFLLKRESDLAISVNAFHSLPSSLVHLSVLRGHTFSTSSVRGWKNMFCDCYFWNQNSWNERKCLSRNSTWLKQENEAKINSVNTYWRCCAIRLTWRQNGTQWLFNENLIPTSGDGVTRTLQNPWPIIHIETSNSIIYQAINLFVRKIRYSLVSGIP